MFYTTDLPANIIDASSVRILMVEKRVYFYYFAGLLTVGVLLLIFLSYRPNEPFVTVEVNGVKVAAEVADDPVEKTQGLMFRDRLGKNEGMIFPFDEEGHYNFWMLNVQFPLDLIWINSDKTIIDITLNAQPCTVNCPTYTSKVKARYVLEVNGGFVSRNNIAVGAQVNFKLSESIEKTGRQPRQGNNMRASSEYMSSLLGVA